MKILDIRKMDKKLSTDEKLERYKPPIFWKDKDRIKNILKIWSSKNIEKLIINLNIIETNFKRNELELSMGIKVDIKNKKNNSGEIKFSYKNLEQLNKIISVLKGYFR